MRGFRFAAVTLEVTVASAMLGVPAQGQMMGPGMMDSHRGSHMGMSVLRHRYFMQRGIPEEYVSAKNPLSATDDNVAAGRALYTANCETCHGPKGYGDGPTAKALDPRPANIAALVRMPMATDGYLMWTLSEGGVPIGSGMPAFKGTLSEAERWQLITYVQTQLGR